MAVDWRAAGVSPPVGPRRSTGLVLAQQLAEARVVADRVEVLVLAHVAEVAVAQLDGPAQRLEALVGPLQPGVAAGQVVVGQRVGGTQLHQAAVDLKPLGVAALDRQQLAHQPQDVDIVGNALEDAGEEVQLEVDLVLVGAPGGAAGVGPGAFVEVLAEVCHLLPPALAVGSRPLDSTSWIITVARGSAKGTCAVSNEASGGMCSRSRQTSDRKSGDFRYRLFVAELARVPSSWPSEVWRLPLHGAKKKTPALLRGPASMWTSVRTGQRASTCSESLRKYSRM